MDANELLRTTPYTLVGAKDNNEKELTFYKDGKPVVSVTMDNDNALKLGIE